MSDTITLHSVDLDAVVQAYRSRSLAELVTATRRGSLAGLLERSLGGHHVDCKLPAVRALAGAAPEHQRDLFDALVEDAAVGSLWDAPEDACAEVFAALVQVSKEPSLALGAAHATPFVYPADLMEDPFVDHAEARAGMLHLIAEPGRLAVARGAAARALKLPTGAFATANASLFMDLLQSIAELLDHTQRAAVSIVAQRSAG